eukprot:scaffold11619_cov99-Isochrysis_galbana.AAC.2
MRHRADPFFRSNPHRGRRTPRSRLRHEPRPARRCAGAAADGFADGRGAPRAPSASRRLAPHLTRSCGPASARQCRLGGRGTSGPP